MKFRYPTRLVVGVTGGIATGKSSVLQRLSRHGIFTISSDELAHACLQPGHPCFKQVLHHFGSRIIRGDRIDRKRLGRIVFAAPRGRKWLERRIHPHVVKGLKAFIQKHHGLIALDIPLLYEVHLERLVDRVLVVSCSQSDQIKRLKRRNGLTSQEAMQRILSQMPLAYKKKRADYLVDNGGEQASLDRKISHLLIKMKKVLLENT